MNRKLFAPRASFRAVSLATAAVTAAASCIVAPGITSAQTPPKVVINEVESNGDPTGDWIELANLSDTSDIDLSGWTIIDNDPTHTPITIPAGTKIESGGYFVLPIETSNGGFGLGSKDSVTVFDASGAIVDTYAWTEHATTTYARTPDRTGAFTLSSAPTRGLKNEAPADSGTPSAAEAWPYDPTTTETLTPKGAGDTAGDSAVQKFAGEDMSGVDFDKDGNAYIVNNDAGELFVLSAKDNTITHHLTLKYPDGSGTVDTEGVSVADDGTIYVATERNNEDKKVSRPSVLTFAPLAKPTAGATVTGTVNAQKEVNLAEHIGDVGANAGLEAVEYLGSTLVAAGVEGTGEVLLVDTATNTLKQRYKSPFAGVMALDYNPATKTLRALCDEVCDGQSTTLTFDGTVLTPSEKIFARPAGMENYANEGFAQFDGPCVAERAVNAEPTRQSRFIWADDAGTNGASLRTATTTTPCQAEGAQGSLGSAELNTPQGSATFWGALAAIVAVGGLITAGLFNPQVQKMIADFRQRFNI